MWSNQANSDPEHARVLLVSRERISGATKQYATTVLPNYLHGLSAVCSATSHHYSLCHGFDARSQAWVLNFEFGLGHPLRNDLTTTKTLIGTGLGTGLIGAGLFKTDNYRPFLRPHAKKNKEPAPLRKHKCQFIS